MAIKSVFGENAKSITISSTKSMTGHLLGGAGAFEAMVSLLVMQNNKVPPTINLTTADEECDLNYTPNVSIDLEVNKVMSNSFGFGGHNGALVFSKN